MINKRGYQQNQKNMDMVVDMYTLVDSSELEYYLLLVFLYEMG